MYAEYDVGRDRDGRRQLRNQFDDVQFRSDGHNFWQDRQAGGFNPVGDFKSVDRGFGGIGEVLMAVVRFQWQQHSLFYELRQGCRLVNRFDLE